MEMLWITAIVSLIFGVLFLFLPKTLVKLSELANQVLLYSDEHLYKLRVGLGICFLGISIAAFFTIYYIFAIS